MSIKIFKDALVYRLTQPVEAFSEPRLNGLDDLLATKLSRQPGSQELGTFGFIEPVGGEDSYFEQIDARTILITAQQWKRDLPASVVTRELKGKIARIEEEQQRKVYSKERNQLKDEIIQRLLPRAFIKGKQVSAMIQGDLIFIDTASAKLAEQLLSLLREVLGSLPVRPVAMKTNPITWMTEWLRQGEIIDSDAFLLGESFQAKGAHEESSTLSGKAVDLSEEDIRNLLDAGRQVTQLGLMFGDEGRTNIRFTLDEGLVLKGIQWPEEMLLQAERDAGEEAEWITTQRAVLMLISDCLGRLFAELVEALGGEDRPDQVDDTFEKRMAKAEKDLAKIGRNYLEKHGASVVRLGDSNLATDFPIIDETEDDHEEGEANDELVDSLYADAVDYVRTHGRASISAVQRQFKLGYNRAARLMERMAEEGIVTEIDSNGGREVIRKAIEDMDELI